MLPFRPQQTVFDCLELYVIEVRCPVPYPPVSGDGINRSCVPENVSSLSSISHIQADLPDESWGITKLKRLAKSLKVPGYSTFKQATKSGLLVSRLNEHGAQLSSKE